MNTLQRIDKVTKNMRVARGLSQEQFCAQCGIDQHYISNIENGQRNISIDVVERISRFFGLSLSQFFAVVETLREIPADYRMVREDEPRQKSGPVSAEAMESSYTRWMKQQGLSDRTVVYGRGLGGTTTLATGNAVRADKGLKAIGINLDAEFDELYRELPITTDHQRQWSKVTKQTFQAMQDLGFDPQPMPKLVRPSLCRLCGHCSIGCPHRAKWDTREMLDGIKVITNCRVERVECKGERVERVVARQGLRKATFEADVVVLAAGGLGTPQILSNSGIECQQRLFVDPVLCVAAPMQNAKQDRHHPGGMLPLTAAEAETLHSPLLPDNLYVADASLLPQSLGLPPILTIMALTKKISRIIITNNR